MPDTTAKRQTADAGRGDNPGRHGKTECVSRVIHVSPKRPATTADRLLCRIHVNIPNAGQIDDQAVITHAETACVVTSAPDGHQQLVFTGEIHCGDDVCNILALRDRLRPAVDHAVVNLAGIVVARISPAG